MNPEEPQTMDFASYVPVAQLKALLETSDAMMKSVLIGDRQRTLDTLTRHIHDNLRAESCAIYLLGEELRDTICLESSYTDKFQTATPSSQVKIAIRSLKGGGLTGHLAHAGKIVRMSKREMQCHECWAGSPPKHLELETCFSLLAIPLKDRKGRLLGLLKAENKKGIEGVAEDGVLFTKLDEDIARVLANKLVIVIENLRTVGVYQGLIQDIQRHETYDKILQAILRRVIAFLKVDRGDLALWSDQQMNLVSAAVVGPEDDTGGHRGTPFPQKSLVRKTWNERNVLMMIYPDVSKAPEYHSYNPRTRSEVLVRLRLDGRAIGILNLESFNLNGFDDQDEAQIKLISSALSVAVHMAAKQTRFVGLLDDATKPKERSENFLNNILEAVREIYGFDGGVIHIANEAGNKLVCSAYMDSEAQAFNPKNVSYFMDSVSIVTKVFKEKEPYYSENVRNDTNADLNNALIKSINGPAIGLPLLWGSKPLGAMLIWSRQNRPPTIADVSLLMPFASLAAARIAGSENRDSQRHIAALQAIGNIPPELLASLTDERYLRLIFLGIQAAGFERARIFKFRKESESFECTASYGPKSEQSFRGRCTSSATSQYTREILSTYSVNLSAREFDPKVPQSFGDDPSGVVFEKPSDLPWAAVPLVLNGHLYGLITADNKLTRKTIFGANLEYLTLIATEVSKALSTSETVSFYKSVVEYLPAKVVHKGKDGRIVFANDAYRSWCGKTLAELTQLTDLDLHPADLARKYRDDDNQILNGDVPKIEDDEEHELNGGARISVHVVKSPIKDINDNIIGVQIVFWNTADADLAALMKLIPDSIYFKDEKSRFRQISKFMADRLNLRSPEDAIGKSDFDFFINSKGKIEDEEKLMMRGGQINKIEAEIYKNSSKTRWVSTAKVRLERGGKIIGTCGISRDVTNTMLRGSSLSGFRNLFESANDMIYTRTINGQFLSLNRAGQRLTGYSLTEFQNLNLLDIVAPEFVEPVRAFLTRKTKGNQKTHNEIVILAKDGRKMEIEFTTHPIRLIELVESESPVPIKKIVIVGIGRDVTERNQNRRRLEKLVQNAKDLEKIAWGVNYSLRTRAAAWRRKFFSVKSFSMAN